MTPVAIACPMALMAVLLGAWGADCPSAVVPAVTNAVPAVTNAAPEAFNLAGGVIWRKFRKVKDQYVLGKPAEGAALRLFNLGLRSRNPQLAAEARTILDAFSETRDVLGERLLAARAAGDSRADAMIRLYIQSFPSQRARFAPAAAKPKKERTAKNGL